MTVTTLSDVCLLAVAGLAGGGFAWWQALGGTLAVFALLILVLRLLGRWQGQVGRGAASLLAVLPLGHRREIQVLRLKGEVHYIYRHEGALLLLDRESYDSYRASNPATTRMVPRAMPNLLTRLLGISRASERQQDAVAAPVEESPRCSTG